MKNIDSEMKRQTGSLAKMAAILLMAMVYAGCGNPQQGSVKSGQAESNTEFVTEDTDDLASPVAVLVSPENPVPGQVVRVIVAGGAHIRKSAIIVTSQNGALKPVKSRSSAGLPAWKIEEFQTGAPGKYMVALRDKGTTTGYVDFTVANKTRPQPSQGVWNSEKGWDAGSELLYSAWINALFCTSDERASWKALHQVTQDRENNFLFNHLSLDEDNPASGNRITMQPDCADNPFFLRAYFAWKLGLPFGFHECDRGYLGHPPHTGRWITNEASISGSDPVRKFNTFIRMAMNGVHSGTARTALNDDASDYYPVPLSATALRPGVVYADPYGHTLVLVNRLAQTRNQPGLLLSVDAQPDGTVGIKRFWKGNFLFNTEGVVGEPGFKAFRPITLRNGKLTLLSNKEIEALHGMVPFSAQQKNMAQADFYHTMDRIINPKPMDPETVFLDLLKALHEQLVVRVTSVGNGEEYMRKHPGEVIAMPGSPAGVFQAGGQWEDFSTPNRDLRLLIAMDAVLEFPAKMVESPGDYKFAVLQTPENARKKLEELLEKKKTELTITYTRTDGSAQVLTLGELLKRREAFEMAYNPNDGIEIRWGAPEGSQEISTCRRHVPASQAERMKSVRQWFHKRLHPPT